MVNLILPPPFTIPLFLKGETDKSYILNTLSLATVIFVFLFAILVLLTSLFT